MCWSAVAMSGAVQNCLSCQRNCFHKARRVCKRWKWAHTSPFTSNCIYLALLVTSCYDLHYASVIFVVFISWAIGCITEFTLLPQGLYTTFETNVFHLAAEQKAHSLDRRVFPTGGHRTESVLCSVHGIRRLYFFPITPNLTKNSWSWGCRLAFFPRMFTYSSNSQTYGFVYRWSEYVSTGFGYNCRWWAMFQEWIFWNNILLPINQQR